MKDSEYIELLNLYLDHEISAADAARLEAEVQTNPARRRVYQQYCRMQKACKMVGTDFQADTEGTAVATAKKVVAFDPTAIAAEAGQRKRVNGLYTVGTFAAFAACVTIIFVGRNHQRAVSEQAGVATPPAAAVVSVTPRSDEKPNVTPGTNATLHMVSLPPRSHSPLVGDPLFLTGHTQAEAVRTAAIQQADDQLKWIDAVQLAPLQQRALSEFRFDATLRSESRALGNRSSSAPKPRETAEEMVTFRFGK